MFECKSNVVYTDCALAVGIYALGGGGGLITNMLIELLLLCSTQLPNEIFINKGTAIYRPRHRFNVSRLNPVFRICRDDLCVCMSVGLARDHDRFDLVPSTFGDRLKPPK